MMKRIILLTLLFISVSIHSQEIEVLNAVQEVDGDFFDYEDYENPDKPIGDLVFLKGCSWYCGGDVKLIKASSTLKPNNNINYNAENAHDFNKHTAWIEGKKGYGVGEYLTYYIDFSDNPNYQGSLGINTIYLANGYKKNKKTWQNNSRVKQLKMYVNGKSYAYLNLLDSFEIQSVNLSNVIMFPPNKETVIRFEITKVYPGEKYKDTAISLLMFNGVGVH